MKSRAFNISSTWLLLCCAVAACPKIVFLCASAICCQLPRFNKPVLMSGTCAAQSQSCQHYNTTCAAVLRHSGSSNHVLCICYLLPVASLQQASPDEWDLHFALPHGDSLLCYAGAFCILGPCASATCCQSPCSNELVLAHGTCVFSQSCHLFTEFTKACQLADCDKWQLQMS